MDPSRPTGHRPSGLHDTGAAARIQATGRIEAADRFQVADRAQLADRIHAADRIQAAAGCSDRRSRVRARDERDLAPTAPAAPTALLVLAGGTSRCHGRTPREGGSRRTPLVGRAQSVGATQRADRRSVSAGIGCRQKTPRTHPPLVRRARRVRRVLTGGVVV